MSNIKEIELDNDAQIDQHLLEALVQAPEGHCKNASDMTSQVVRRRLRETGFRRLVLPDKPISDSELVMLPDTELPVVVELMEMDSPGAKTISFNDTADTAKAKFCTCDNFETHLQYSPGWLARLNGTLQ